MDLRRIRLLMASVALGLTPTMAAAAETAATVVRADAPYVRAVPPVVSNSAAYVSLTNGGAVAHTLVGAASPAARAVELHTHSNDGGVMRMRRVDGIPLPAGETTALEPGGYHIMLIDLTGPLEAGGEVELELEFADGSRHRLTAPVRGAGAMGHDHHHHAH